MILNLQKIENLINSELSSKIKNSLIENAELLIEIDESDLIDVVQFLKFKPYMSKTSLSIQFAAGNIEVIDEITSFSLIE